MNPRVSLLALSAVSIALSTPARAEDACTQIIVYAVKQFCQMLPNGQNLCQPVALTGPNPACQVPTPGQFKPVPLAPPTVQFPMGMPMTAPAPFPAMPPVMPPSIPASTYNPYLASPMAAQPVSPFGAQPMPFMAPPAAPATPPAVAQAPVTPPSPAVPPAIPPSLPTSPSSPYMTSPTTARPVSPFGAQPIPFMPPPAATPAPALATPTPSVLAPLPTPVTPPPVVATPTSPVTADASAPEAVTPNLPEAPSLPLLVAEAVALFPFDSAELTPLGKQTLDSWLASAPMGMPVVVYGHADRLGPEDYNMKLSQRRADAARMYLISKGKDPRDIRSVGRGEADPVKRCKGGPTDATKACLAPNRRVLITHE